MQEACSATTSSNRTIKGPSALLFLYRHVISREVGDLGKVIRARKLTRLPVVMTRDEAKAVLSNLSRIAGTQGCQNYDDLHACAELRFKRSAKSN